jgi:hypothetical protein
VLDDLGDRLIFPRELDRRDARGLDLLGHQVPARDLELVLVGITGQFDDLHPVPQCRGNGVEHVGGGNEHHLRKVERDIQVVIPERVVLLRIENLEQGGRGIAPPVVAELVDLVQHEHRIVRSGTADRLDDPARHRADVCAPVTANFGLIAHAA